MHTSKELNTLNNFRYWRSSGDKYFFFSSGPLWTIAFVYADVSSLPPSQSQKISSIQKQSTSYEAPSSDSDQSNSALIIGYPQCRIIAIVVGSFYILIFASLIAMQTF